MKYYVTGFMYSENYKKVALIEKNNLLGKRDYLMVLVEKLKKMKHPKWQFLVNLRKKQE